MFGFAETTVVYTPTMQVGPDHAEDLKRSISILEVATARAPEEMIVYELGRLRVQTKSKAEDSDGIEFILRVYAEDMREYPADVVREACRKWARTEKFFPAWSELKDILDRMTHKRRRLLSALKYLRDFS